VRQGLKGGEALVVNPPSDLQDGQAVHVGGDGGKGAQVRSKG